MKKKLTYCIFFWLIFSSFPGFSQTENLKGYRIEGDTVIFSFDKNDYKKATSEATGRKYDFEDLDIYNVAVSGNFNEWSKDNWRMKKVGEGRYELRKSLQDFSDEFMYEFKFVVNNDFWAEPSRKVPNITQAVKDGHHLGVYNLKMYTGFPKDNGNVTFRLKGFENAKHVILSGSFNKWNEALFKMKKTERGWELTLELKPGQYEYKFIVDGKWMEDPNNPSKVINEFGEYNSCIGINVPITFKLKGYRTAKKVILAGSFNDWDENTQQMTKTNSGWECTVLLSGGKHHYKFIVDGNWMLDPANTVSEYDGKGNVNSVKMVK